MYGSVSVQFEKEVFTVEDANAYNAYFLNENRLFV